MTPPFVDLWTVLSEHSDLPIRCRFFFRGQKHPTYQCRLARPSSPSTFTSHYTKHCHTSSALLNNRTGTTTLLNSRSSCKYSITILHAKSSVLGHVIQPEHALGVS